jgi:Bacterial TniB protein
MTRTEIATGIAGLGAVPAPPADYIYYPRLDALKRDIYRVLDLSRTYGQPYCMALGGVAGSGKSTFLYKIMEGYRRREADDLTHIPVLYVELSSPITRKGAARALLQGLGDPGPMAQLDYDEINTRVIALLRACRVQLVILDDFHHVIKKNEIDWELSEWLKTLIKKSSVPFLVVGLPEKVTRILRANAQLSRLFAVRETLHPFAWDPRDAEVATEFGQFIAFAEASLGMPLTDRVKRAQLLDLLFQATDGIAGNVINLLRYARLEARDRGGATIALADLWLGFAKWLDGHLQAEDQPRRPNPFPPPDAAAQPRPASAGGPDPPEAVNNRSRRRKPAE